MTQASQLCSGHVTAVTEAIMSNEVEQISIFLMRCINIFFGSKLPAHHYLPSPNLAAREATKATTLPILFS